VIDATAAATLVIVLLRVVEQVTTVSGSVEGMLAMTSAAADVKELMDTKPIVNSEPMSEPPTVTLDRLTVTYPDGTLKRITNYHNGEVGESTLFYPDGTIESVTPHQNGEMHGTVKHYRENGTLEYDITFCNGETCGEQHNYDEQGNIVKIIRWGANGDAEEQRDYDKQGNIVKITRFNANGDVESVEEVRPGRKPRKKS